MLYATEAGFKSELFDNRLRLNASYFHYTYKNVQVRSVAPPAPPGNALLLNAASERVDGIDADFSIVPFHGLTINGTLEHLIAAITVILGRRSSLRVRTRSSTG